MTKPVKKEPVISITQYALQRNIGVVQPSGTTEPEKKELGFYLLADGKTADCYRNTKIIEIKGITGPELKLNPQNNQRITTGKNIHTSVNTIRPRNCGSDCVMFQLLEKSKRTFVKLNCTKTEYEITGEVVNEFPMK